VNEMRGGDQMNDDPRDILKQAGVECVDLYNYLEHPDVGVVLTGDHPRYIAPHDAAILALAKLVAKYKWQRDWCMTSDVRYVNQGAESDLEYLDDLWEGRDSE